MTSLVEWAVPSTVSWQCWVQQRTSWLEAPQAFLLFFRAIIEWGNYALRIEVSYVSVKVRKSGWSFKALNNYLGQIGNKELRKISASPMIRFVFWFWFRFRRIRLSTEQLVSVPNYSRRTRKTTFFEFHHKILLRSRRILKCSAWRLKRLVVSFVF